MIIGSDGSTSCSKSEGDCIIVESDSGQHLLIMVRSTVPRQCGDESCVVCQGKVLCPVQLRHVRRCDGSI